MPHVSQATGLQWPSRVVVSIHQRWLAAEPAVVGVLEEAHLVVPVHEAGGERGEERVEAHHRRRRRGRGAAARARASGSSGRRRLAARRAAGASRSTRDHRGAELSRVRAQRDGPPQERRGLVPALLVRVERAQVGERTRHVGRQPEGLAERGLGLGVAALGGERDAQVVVRLGPSRPQARPRRGSRPRLPGSAAARRARCRGSRGRARTPASVAAAVHQRLSEFRHTFALLPRARGQREHAEGPDRRGRAGHRPAHRAAPPTRTTRPTPPRRRRASAKPRPER